VGDRGVLLSGGERQRLALARALLREPDLLVLDEATSALDAETEARILQTVRALRGRCTVVFCTHRESVREAADEVIRL
jgi:ABC-type multidrug transport system fused ATPase/permease subunit